MASAMIPFNNLSSKIEILYDDQNQPWFKQVHVGEYISIANMRDATSKIDLEDKKSRVEITVARHRRFLYPSKTRQTS